MDVSADADSQEEAMLILQYYASNLIFNYANLAVFVTMVYEYLITFDREVRFAWGRETSWARTVFFLNRYLSILASLVALGPLLPTVNFFSCVLLTRLMQTSQIALYAVWAAFSGVRVYAISGRNWYITLTVVTLALVPVATNSYVSSVTPTVPDSILGCMAYMNISALAWTELSVVTRSCMIVSDAIVILVTWVKTWSTVRAANRLRVRMSFTSLILKEGIIYFGVTLTLNILQIIFDFVEVGSFSLILLFINVFTPVLISRFYLDLDDLNTHDKSLTYGMDDGLSLEFAIDDVHLFESQPAYRFDGYHNAYEFGVKDLAAVDQEMR